MPKVNAYSAFIYTMIKEHHLRSFPEAEKKYGLVWKNMKPEEKGKYKDIARVMNGNEKKMTTTGEAVDDILQRQKEEQEKHHKMVQTIEEIIESAINDGTIKTQEFYVMHMHFFCFRHDRYWPAEVGIAKFNLQSGVIKTFHRVIDPGKLPLGSAYEAKNHTDQTHQLPVPSTDENKNLDKVLTEMLFFFEINEKDKLPVVFARNEQLGEKGSGVITNIFQNFFHKDIQVWSIEYLLLELSKKILGPTGLPLISLVEQKMTDDVFEFYCGRVCNFHKNCDSAHLCSLSCAVRLVFHICSQVCQPLGIKLIGEHHVPRTFVPKAYEPLPVVQQHVPAPLPAVNPWEKNKDAKERVEEEEGGIPGINAMPELDDDFQFPSRRLRRPRIPGIAQPEPPAARPQVRAAGDAGDQPRPIGRGRGRGRNLYF